MDYLKTVSDKNIIISVDIALNKSGIAVTTDTLAVLHTEVLSLKKNMNYYEKLSSMMVFFSGLFRAIMEAGPKSIELVLEGRLQRGFSGSALASIEGARITTYHAFDITLKDYERYEKKVSVYSPDLIKSFFTGKRNATKADMRKAAYSRISSLKKIDFQEDIFDALYLSIFHVYGRKAKGDSTPAKRKPNS